MNILLAHDHYSKDHLNEIIAEMRTVGAPTIKAVWMDCYDAYAALEGCHRIRAAKALGLTPIIDELNYDDVADLDIRDKSLGLDFDNDGTVATVLLDDCHRREMIKFS